MLVFADTNIVIYLIEQPAGFGPRATAYVNAAKAAGDRIVVSDLVRMECRVGPLAANDTVTLGEYEQFFTSNFVDLVPVTRGVCERAAAIRAQHRFRPLDALHLAAAVENACSRFVTNDLRLHGFPDIPIELLP
jgi:predicted nucleic acid-binding protein